MHDIRLIRDNPEAFDAAMAKRGKAPESASILDLDKRRREIVTELQIGQARRNEVSKAIGAAKAAKDEATASALMAEVASLKERLPHLESEDARLGGELDDLLAGLPNIPLPDVPEGADEEDNQLVHERGEKRAFGFPVREHDAIGPALGLDFETGAAIAGARFTLVRGAMARLSRALGQFGLDILTRDHGYEEVVPPLLVKSDAMFGTGQLPKFAEDLFRTSLRVDHDEIEKIVLAVMSDEDLSGSTLDIRERIERAGRNALVRNEQDANLRWLIPTAEVSLTNIVREKILAANELPLRFTALTACFRSEAGAAGRDTRGFIRQHQFEKAEMVSIVEPDASETEHERMTAAAEDVLTRLGLPFRRMKLCTGDMGFTAARTYDLEVWLPGQARYREISSCSTCTDFQARRMNARYRPEGEKATRFVHTLNGSGLVVGRMIVAILENYQQEDGSVWVPDALQSYLGGLNRLEPRR